MSGDDMSGFGYGCGDGSGYGWGDGWGYGDGYGLRRRLGLPAAATAGATATAVAGDTATAVATATVAGVSYERHEASYKGDSQWRAFLLGLDSRLLQENPGTGRRNRSR